MQVRKFAATAAAVGLVAAGAGGAWVSTADAAPGASPGGPGQDNGPGPDPAASITTATPIKHLVVIFQENVSFDHYFGTYPFATNADGSPFTATPEQRAFDQGLMDKFVQNTDNESCSPPAASPSGLVMDYYDGNTVTAVWNYAQHFSMNDNSFNTVFGPSTAGALNLISGQTHGTTSASGAVDNGTVFGDADPTFDDCSSTSKPTIAMIGRNIGDMLSAAKISWGWFEGGFAPTSAATATAKAFCGNSHQNIGGVT